MEFKMGDKVRILGGTKQERWTSSGNMKETIGQVGEIYDISCGPAPYLVEFKGESWWYNAEDLEIAEEAIDLRKLIEPSFVVNTRNHGLWLVGMTKAGICYTKNNGMAGKYQNEYDNKLNCKGVFGCDIMEIYGHRRFACDCNELSVTDREKIWVREEMSPMQIKLEELEKQQREIADKIAELRKEIK